MREVDPDASRPWLCTVSSGRRQTDPTRALAATGVRPAPQPAPKLDTAPMHPKRGNLRRPPRAYIERRDFNGR